MRPRRKNSYPFWPGDSKIKPTPPFQAIYEKEQSAAAAPGADDAPSADDDVVDAEFKEVKRDA